MTALAQNETQSVTPNNPEIVKSTMNPPNAVPRPGMDSDGGLIVGVTGLWLLTLVIVFSIFAMTPKLMRRARKRGSMQQGNAHGFSAV